MSLKCALVGAVAYLQANALFNPFFSPISLVKTCVRGRHFEKNPIQSTPTSMLKRTISSECGKWISSSAIIVV